MLTAGESQDPTSPTGAGRVLSLIRDGEAVTRADLARRTGLARSTVAQRVEALLAHQLVYEAGGSASTGGRPPTVLAFNRSAGVVLVADLGATHSRLAVSDLAGAPLAERAYDTDVARDPEIGARLGPRALRACCWRRSGATPSDVRGIGIGVPAPVAFSRGEPVAPPMMPGWDGFSIPGWFSRHYDAPVLVDNDVNIMALGEHWTHWRDYRAPALREDRHRHRLRDRLRPADPPRRAGRGGRHRPRAAGRARRRRLPLRQHRLPRGGRGRAGAGGAS